MEVIVDKNNQICHKPDCSTIQFIEEEYKENMTLKEAENYHYNKCKTCLGFGEYIKSQKSYFPSWEQKYHIQIFFNELERFIFVKTNISFWKIYLNYDFNKLQLFHLSELSEEISFHEMSLDELKNAKFHRQMDVRPTDSLGKIINYIGEHDKAKQIIADNYKKLPTNTKRRKKYFKRAERREKWKEMQRLDKLFELIKE